METNETIELAGDLIFAKNYARRNLRFKYYWAKEEDGLAYVLRKSIDDDKTSSDQVHLKDIEEAFFVVPFNTKNNRCHVHFITNFNYGIGGNTFIHKISDNYIKMHRLEILSGFRAFQKE